MFTCYYLKMKMRKKMMMTKTTMRTKMMKKRMSLNPIHWKLES